SPGAMIIPALQYTKGPRTITINVQCGTGTTPGGKSLASWPVPLISKVPNLTICDG
ncbi:hypothetical protein JI435_023220, partial [Parastagonospora nodorum SN15]